MRITKVTPALLAALLLGAAPAARAQLTVAAAANVQYAMEEIKAAFQRQTGSQVKAAYGPSGKFATQIKNGAPFDVFVSADTDFPDSLVKWKSASGQPKVYAYGTLILWTLKDLDPSKGLSILADPGVARFALPDPKRAPYGREAVKAMRKAGIYDSVQAKLITGESISQVSQYITTQVVDIGFDAKSVVLAKDMAGRGHWAPVDSTLYDPIAQAAVVTRYGRDNNPKLAAKFFEFLYSGPAKAILEKYGYKLP